MGVSRTLKIDDLTPEELASLFTELDDREQARFFGEIWKIAREWPGAGWCQQSYSIVQQLGSDGRNAIRTIAEHLEAS